MQIPRMVCRSILSLTLSHIRIKPSQSLLIKLVKRKLLSRISPWYCLLCCTRWFYIWSLWMKSKSVTIQMKATEQNFPVVLFTVLYKVVLTVESVDEILKCDHSSESYRAVLHFSTVYKVRPFR